MIGRASSARRKTKIREMSDVPMKRELSVHLHQHPQPPASASAWGWGALSLTIPPGIGRLGLFAPAAVLLRAC